MTLRISGKNLDIGDALRTHVNARVGEALARYFEGTFSGHVTVRKEGVGFRTDCLIHLATGLTLQSESLAYDPHASVDQAAERLTRRLKRHKQRIRDHHAVAAPAPDFTPASDLAPETTERVIEAPDEDADAAPGGFDPVVIAEGTQRMKRLSVSEAVSDLDLSGAPVLVFRHAGHGRVNVVYRRPDGHIGWIDLPAAAADAA